MIDTIMNALAGTVAVVACLLALVAGLSILTEEICDIFTGISLKKVREFFKNRKP